MKPFRDEQRGEVNAQTIISSLGNFHEARFDKDLAYCPARYGARISQAFTSTDQGIEVDVTEQCDEADIRRNSWVFTDGVGTISEEMAEAIRHAVYSRRNRRRPAVDPTVFQIRFQVCPICRELP
jgi:RNA-dependent RNA polymerase